MTSAEKKFRILFVTNESGDFLADSFFLGLKLNGYQVIETKVKKILYKGAKVKSDIIHGNGFTLYGLIDLNQALEVDRDIDSNYLNTFDFIIFSSIHRQYGIFLYLFRFLIPSKTIILDGEDAPNLFCYSGNYWRRPELWLLPKAHKIFHYFKRELSIQTLYYRYYTLLPRIFLSKLTFSNKLHTISFSIPSCKIINYLPVKKKLFPKHIVDEEICSHIDGATTSHAFKDENAYYNDLQISKFGITMKRSGWDCLRHYEIAANAAVICFKNLHLKPDYSAPHGLIDGINCISYTSYKELICKIENLSTNDYQALQSNSLEWIKSKTSEKLSFDLLNYFNNINTDL